MGQRTVSTTAGTKNYGQAQFEIRGSTAFTVNGVNSNNQPAKNWVAYAKLVFDAAHKRSYDTPNDPTTTGTDESSNTALKK